MTTSTQVTLAAQDRHAFGHRNGALRRAGITPLHVYGHGEDSLALQAGSHDVTTTLARVGRTAPLVVRVGDDEHFVMVREVQRHPVTAELLHVDLIRISRTEKIRVQVPVHVEGEAPAARGEGLSLSHDLYEVEVEALPLDIPSVFTIDVSSMEEPDAVIRVGTLVMPANVTLITDPETPIARIVAQRGTEEAETPAGEGAPVAGGAATKAQAAPGAPAAKEEDKAAE